MASNSEMDNLRKDITKLEAQIKSSKEDLAKIEEHKASAEKIGAKVNEFEKKVANKEKEAKDLNTRHEKLNSNNGALLDDFTKAINTLKARKEVLANLEKEKGVKTPESALSRLGLKLDLLRSGHMLAGRWMVDDVKAGSPISKAGIQVNDILMKVEKLDVLSAEPSLQKDVEDKLKGKDGATVNFQFYREHLAGYLKLDVNVEIPKA